MTIGYALMGAVLTAYMFIRLWNFGKSILR